ncbi:hypothetical protein K402DRAFT_68894 [Aulographum hederae CBS 113979]|uniref:Uncharacterized protein n=1 Tax=Aulographum hederae CBS 113979 TaxID=1176131 RepID=A0A6G1H1L6_9PEZI|nr:hypothetical protein K402DRAFT_68894 [Aulographum hederae CBS 113979]
MLRFHVEEHRSSILAGCLRRIRVNMLETRREIKRRMRGQSQPLESSRVNSQTAKSTCRRWKMEPQSDDEWESTRRTGRVKDDRADRKILENESGIAQIKQGPRSTVRDSPRSTVLQSTGDHKPFNHVHVHVHQHHCYKACRRLRPDMKRQRAWL